MSMTDAFTTFAVEHITTPDTCAAAGLLDEESKSVSVIAKGSPDALADMAAAILKQTKDIDLSELIVAANQMRELVNGFDAGYRVQIKMDGEWLNVDGVATLRALLSL